MSEKHIEKKVTINRASYIDADLRPAFRLWGTEGEGPGACVLVSFEFPGGECKVYAEPPDLRRMAAACLEIADAIDPPAANAERAEEAPEAAADLL